MSKFILILSFLLPVTGFASSLQGVSDTALTIELTELRGVRPHTRNNLYAKAVIQRSGKKFEVFCERRGTVEAQKFTNRLLCEKHVETVSNDDDENLSFEIAVTGDGNDSSIAVQDVFYVGDGTFLGEEAEILTGRDSSEFLENVVIELRQIDRSVLKMFEQGELLNKVLQPLVGREVPVRDGRVTLRLPVEKFSFSVDNDMSVSVSTDLDTSSLERISVDDPAPVSLSLLESAGDLNSGLRAEEDLREEIRQALLISGRSVFD